jgi:UDP-2,4-diacetamido-2,4,6-trideoxy-beta-L-altropyranose hydrolase
MIIIFRCNAGPMVGLGHLTRCRALAYALNQKGQNCIMVGPHKSYMNDKDQNLFIEWISINDWKSSLEDSNILIDIAERHRDVFLVLDDYRINEDYQLNIRKAGIKWLQFDNHENKPLWADIIINPMPGLSNKDFKNVIRNTNAELLLGPNYAILRPEFFKALKTNCSKKIKKVLVTFGGGDDRGGNKFVVSSLLDNTPNNIRFVIISGLKNPNNRKLKNWINSHGKGRIDLSINPKEIAKLFLTCDIAIISGGTTTYEVDCCGIPFVIISIADNQIEQSLAWDKVGKASYLGDINNIDKNLLVSSFNQLLKKKVFLEEKKTTTYDGLYKVSDLIISKKN